MVRTLYLESLYCATYYALFVEHYVQQRPPTQTEGTADIGDAATLRAAAVSIGDAAVGDPFANAPATPTRMNGGGLLSIAGLAAAPFVGAACRTLTRILPRAGNDDPVVPGYVPQLGLLLGHLALT